MANEKFMKIPYFAKGKAESLERALISGKFADLDKALFYFAIDTNQWILVDVDKTIHAITGIESAPDRGCVRRSDELPSILDGDLETIYLVGDEMYSFNGHEYIAVDNKIGILPDSTTVVEYVAESKDEAIADAHQYTDEQMQLNIVKGGG